MSAHSQSQSSEGQLQTNGQTERSASLERPIVGANVPSGFIDIPFGTTFEHAEKLLTERGYRLKKEGGWKITLENGTVADHNAEWVSLSFGDSGFYKGEAEIKIVYDKRGNQGAEAFEKMSRTIQSKYRTFPRLEQKTRKDGRNYWTTEWEFKTKDNKTTAYEIKLHLQDEWKDWQKRGRIYITYLDAWAVPRGPEPPKAPSHGL
jgi:hypothetical protein